jgi:hypothetical protein
MNFEFLIAYRWTEAADIEQLLVDLLAKGLQGNLNDIESEAAKQRFQKVGRQNRPTPRSLRFLQQILTSFVDPAGVRKY